MARTRRHVELNKLKKAAKDLESEDLTWDEYLVLFRKIQPFYRTNKEAKWARKMTNRKMRQETKLCLKNHGEEDITVYPKAPRTSGWITH